MSNQKASKEDSMSMMLTLMKVKGISLIDFIAFNMEEVMREDGTELVDIPSVLHGLSRNVVGALAPE